MILVKKIVQIIFICFHFLNEIYGNIHCIAHRHVYIVLVQILIHLLTCHTTQALIKCPLFLFSFDLIYPTFIFYLYFSKSWINGNEPNFHNLLVGACGWHFDNPPIQLHHISTLYIDIFCLETYFWCIFLQINSIFAINIKSRCLDCMDGSIKHETYTIICYHRLL